MSDAEKIEKLEKKVTVLTILAISALLMSASAMLSLAFVQSVRNASGERAGSRLPELGRLGSGKEGEKHVIPPPSDDPSEMIESSKAIVLAEHEERKGKLQAIIREVLWISPGTKFRHGIGDEIGHPLEIEPNTRYGDSLVIFFEGNPARFTRSCSVYDDRIPSFDDLEMSEFREMVETAVADKK